MNNRMALACLMLVAWAAAPVVGEDKKGETATAGKPAAFERFKLLAGEWTGKAVKGPEAGKEVRATYKVTSAGSAVVETLLPSEEHEMITVIHPDGADLLLTHYCALGNQPHMKATGQGAGDKVVFKFVRATNLKSDKDPHMHDVTFTFIDKDTFRTEWTYFKDGKAGAATAFEMKRKK